MSNNNTSLIKVAEFVRDLMTIPESMIRIGREGFRRDDFAGKYVVVDALGPFQRLSSGEMFDGVAESMAYSAVWRGTVTIDFYGPDAYGTARNFVLLMRSQTAHELKAAAGIEIHQPGPITDVKVLTGEQYGERMQVEMTVEISESAAISTLRIDTAQIQIQDEKGRIL